MGVSHRGSFASSLQGRELQRQAATAAGLRAANVERAHVYVNSERFWHLRAFVFASCKRANFR